LRDGGNSTYPNLPLLSSEISFKNKTFFIAGNADSSTKKPSDRRGPKVLLDDMERIRY
jgi:hypothetical protein